MASRFIELIFFLLNPALVLWDAFVILSSSSSIWDFKLSFSASKFFFLASLESLFHLHFSCLLVRGASNSGCLTLFSRSHSGSQLAPLGGTPEGDICGGRFGSQVDISGVGTGDEAQGPSGALAHLCGSLCHLWAWASPVLCA